MIEVRWGNRLELLAEAMFADMDAETAACPEEVLGKRQCVIVPNRIVQHWLQHEFLFRNRGPRTLANVDFPLLNVFVNERLFRMANPGSLQRDPEAHPFSREALAWRIFQTLGSPVLNERGFEPLQTHVRPPAQDKTGSRTTRRRFKLAVRLATLFDEYTVYRPEMLLRWERGETAGLQEELAWQPALWRTLTAGKLREQTYLASFVRMQHPQNLPASGVAGDYRCIRIFGVGMVPRVYLHFFELLSVIVPVEFHVLNPCRGDWFAAPAAGNSPWEGRPDPDDALFAPGNAFLGQQGRGNRNFLVELLDRTDGQAEAGSSFLPPGTNTLLHTLQSQVLDNAQSAVGVPTDGETEIRPAFRSVQIHLCHGPMREVEVLRDHLLRWFSEEPGLQPRHVQVQVADMALYAPYLHAVFATPHPGAANAIPYAIADRVAASESPVAEAFARLLALADSRFAAPEVLDLLQCPALREAFGIEEHAVDSIRIWVDRAGIRWGRSSSHREEAVGVRFEDFTTWRRGLDRLLLGYAYGRDGCADPAAAGIPLPCDCAEGDDAVTLGRFARFVERMEQLASLCAAPRTLDVWADALDDTISECFNCTDATYTEIGQIRSAVAALRKSALAAQAQEKVGIEVVRDFLSARLKDVLGGDSLAGNVAVVSALRPGSSVPRRILCLLGMADGQFPRSDNRPSYDLLQHERRFGDRSLRQEDRMAFLEAVLSARDRLYISYPGLVPGEDREVPSSVVVAELRDALQSAAGRDSGSADAASACWPVRHRLQRHHPDYFPPSGETAERAALFSFSRSACATAAALAERRSAPEQAAPQNAETPAGSSANQSPEDAGIELEQLIRFFKNPVKAFYKEVLGVTLDAGSELALAEQESFTPRGLEVHEVREAVVDALAAGSGEDGIEQVRTRLLEGGRIPLGRRGRQWFEGAWQDIRAFLEQPIAELGGPLLDAVREQRTAVPEEHAVAFGNGAGVSGRLALFDWEGAPRAVDFRFVTDKPEDRIACRLRHLFACAAGLRETRIYVRRANDKPVTVPLEALDSSAAGDALRVYVDLYREGRANILPFAIKASSAYATKWHKGLQDAENSELLHREALAAARDAWEKSGFNGIPAESADPYLAAAFGARGPFADPEAFARVALAILPEAQP